MGEILKFPVTDAMALEALSELEGAGLVKSSGPLQADADTRRALLKAAGLALPVVLSLTAAEHRAYAQKPARRPPRVELSPISIRISFSGVAGPAALAYRPAVQRLQAECRGTAGLRLAVR